MEQIPFAVTAYESRSKPMMSQRCINLYAEKPPEGSKSPVALYGTPGLTQVYNFGGVPIHGAHNMVGTAYFIAGIYAYKTDEDGNVTQLGSIGSNSSRVMTADNGTQIFMVKENGEAWIITSTGTARVTDPDFPLVSSVTFIDGYFLITEKDTGKFYITALYDGSSLDALDFATAEDSPDNLVRAFKFSGAVWLFGTESIEVWYNSGAANFPFEAIPGSVIERGCIAKYSVAEEDNTIIWLGDDLIVYRAEGTTPTRISTHGIEKEIEGFSKPEDAFAFIYTQEGHKFYVLTFPESGGKTFAYDFSTQLWHQRQTTGLTRWRANAYVKAFNKHYIGDYDTGIVYDMDLDIYTENGAVIRRIAASPPLWAGDDNLVYDKILIDFDAGVGLTTGQGSNPQIMLRYSDDGGETWSNQLWRTMGAIGKYKTRAIWRRLGSARQRLFEIQISDPVKVAITGAYADITVRKG